MLNSKKSFEVYRLPTIKWLTRDKKGTRSIRKVWKPKEDPPLECKTKWQNELNIPENENCKHIFLTPVQCKLNVRCIYFHFKIIHRTLKTNRKLKQFKIKESEICDKCEHIETIAHLLYECQEAKDLWDAIQNWLRSISPNTSYFDKKWVLLGNSKNGIIVNNIIMITKHEIYKSKWTKSRLNIHKVKIVIKHQMELEIYLGTIKNCLPKVLGKWALVFNNLQTLWLVKR